MKFLDTKFKKILNHFTKAIFLLTLVSILFSPFGQIIGTPVVHAAGRSCTIDLNSNVTCTTDPSVPDGQTKTTDARGGSTTTKGTGNDDALACSLDNPSICLANVVYAFTVGLGGGLAYVGGFMLDTTVSLSLNSAAYALTFLASGWGAARDLANMAFILILVYIAFMIMFEAETAGTIRTLALVVFIALIINFSFFFTRVVIDVGNILAVQFYNSIQAPTLQQTMDTTSSQTGVLANAAAGAAIAASPQGSLSNTKDLTYSIMTALNLQQLFSDENFKSFAHQSGFGTKFIILSFLYLTVGACYFILAAMFFAVSIKFIVRVVVLWFLIIASPLAFVCKAVPRKAVSAWYDKWQHELINHAFYPAFFLFIFFFISSIMSSFGGSNGILGGLASSLNAAASNPNLSGFIFIASSVATVAIRLGFVIAMLYIALKASEYMGVRGAGVAHSLTNRIASAGIASTRFGAGLPLRGAAAAGGFAGRNTAGALGNSISRSTTLRTWEKGAFGFAARGIRNAGGYVGERTFDVRNAPGGKSALSLGGLLNVGTGTKNNYMKGIKSSADAKEKRAKDLEPTALEKQNADAKARKELGYAAAEKERDDARALLTTSAARTKKLEEDGKKNTPEWENSVRSQKVDEETLAQAEGKVKAIKAQVDRRAKEISGEGLSKQYASESLLDPTNIGAGNPGFVTRSSKEAALKILKGKSKDQEVLDAIKSYTNGAAAPAPAAPAAAAPARQPLTAQSMNRTRNMVPLSDATERLERALKGQVEAMREATKEQKESGARVERGFSGIHKTVKEVMEKNGKDTKYLGKIVAAGMAHSSAPQPGSRDILERGRSGRPILSAPIAPPVMPAPKPAPTHETPAAPLAPHPIPPPTPPQEGTH